MNLFEHNEVLTNQPLAHRMRPRTLNEYIGQEHIIGKGRLLRRAIQKDQLSSIILYGPPGTGKTTLARVIANTTKSHFSTINAVLSGVKELRYEIEEAKNRLALYGKRTILFIDEVHRWNKSQQDALLPHVENGTCILIGATTENPYFEVNPALVSRSRIFQLLTLEDKDLEEIAYQAINDEQRGYGSWDVKFEEGALEHLISVAQGDARSLLNALELAIETDEDDQEGISHVRFITKAIAEESIQKKAVLYDKEGDYHFDTISAFIKSIRGSDPDAALYWLAKMVVAGENPAFIFRRLLISATEDIGLADPNAISVILADAQAFDRIGLPEGRFHLSHATIYAATAPKSNSTMAFFDALKNVEEEKKGEVPNHLKDPSRDGKGFGHGSGYLYPHAYKDHWVAQQYLPSNLQGTAFYYPSSTGYEGKLKETITKRREAQNEVSLDELHIEHYTTSFDDKIRSKWVQRALHQLGDSFEMIRERISQSAHVKRHENMLILHPGNGFLVWQAIREAPEGSVTVLCDNQEQLQYLYNYAQTLDELHQPIFIESSLESLLHEQDNMKWDKIISMNPFTTSLEQKKKLPILKELLHFDGAIIIAQILPYLSSRISNYIADQQIKGMLEKAESKMFTPIGPPPTSWKQEDLINNIEELNLSVEIETFSTNNKRIFTHKMIEKYILGSYSEYFDEDVNKQIIINHLVEHIEEKELDFKRVFAILKIERKVLPFSGQKEGRS